jgi:alpha-tubulin suppressor-like RCC1 family protein
MRSGLAAPTAALFLLMGCGSSGGESSPTDVATVSVSLTSVTLVLGQATQAAAAPRDAHGNVLVGRTVTWTSSATSVATVENSGLVTAVDVGSATITGTIEGKSGTASLTVSAAAPSGLTYPVNPAVYVTGITIAPNTPTSSGAAIVSYSVSPPLPHGLSLNTFTGEIAGTPTAVASTATYTVTATNSAGSTTAGVSITVNASATPPSGLTYLVNPAVYMTGTAVAPNIPSSTGGAVTSYSISPPLPGGLTLNNAMGVISGTPTAVAPTATYTVTATNSAGSTTAGVSITVNDEVVPPSGLTYSVNPATYTAGTPISPNTPRSSGGAVVSYSVSPALPHGLSLNTATGIIGGTPTAVTSPATYTLTATNSAGSTTAGVSITVNAAVVPPSELTYSVNPAVYTAGTPIYPNTPSSSGGAVVSYSVSPALPQGMSLNTATGDISGTPANVTPPATYTVTATNSAGTTSVAVSITVNAAVVPPSELTYSVNPAVYTAGTPIAPNTPSSSGGAVVSYSVSPVLPAGLSLNTATGVISGTPTGITAQATYTVTATNFGGTTAIDLVIAVEAAVEGMNRTLAAGAGHTCALVNGGVQCWGRNGPGALGNNSTSDSYVPVQVQGLTSGVQAIAAGGEHTCALVNGGVQCWGRNDVGQIGDNSTAYRYVPVQVQGLTSGVQAIAAGMQHTCALVNGGVQCWGSNYFGTLGNNSTSDSSVPVQVHGLTSGVQAIAADGYHTCALVNGDVQCWGANFDGQLGNNSTSDSFVPVEVQGLASGVQAIEAGLDHTCALVSGGLQCWGYNGQGQLGNNSTNIKNLLPVQVQGLTSGVQAVAAADYSTCALVNGGVQCWGENIYGELGNNSTTNSSVPVQVQGLTSGVKAIAVGSSHACALVNNGFQCWGRNYNGQLGNNSTSDSRVPVQVTGLSL